MIRVNIEKVMLMGLFSQAQANAIQQAAAKSKQVAHPISTKSARSVNTELNRISQNVIDYFKGSPAILITSDEQLHDYVTEAIQDEYVGIDTETTGLDRWNDTIVGASLYHPHGVEAYIPMKHLVPIFEAPCKNQLTYQQVGREFKRLSNRKVKCLYANADFDLAMIYKDLEADLCDSFYWDVILAWRCMKENEQHNDLKSLYNKYVLKGKGDPKRFSDFFPVALFPYCKPDVAKLYAANDAKITYELFKWQLPYVTVGHPKCTKAHLEQIASLVWNVEMPLVSICQKMHRTGMYLDADTSFKLRERYNAEYEKEVAVLRDMVQQVIDSQPYRIGNSTPPFRSGDKFNPTSPPHVKYLLYDLLKLPPVGKGGTGKEVIAEYNLPITKQILKVRSLSVLINTFVDKMPNAVWPDQRIHGQFKQVGADTGRMCLAEGTMIQLATGGAKHIEQIHEGDMVYCYDDHLRLKTGMVSNQWQTGTNKDCLNLICSTARVNKTVLLTCTPEHQIRTGPNSYKPAQELNIGDTVISMIDCDVNREIQYTKMYVNGILYGGKHAVYDIEVGSYHNFVANYIDVHNSSANPNLQNIPSHAVDIRHMFRATPRSEIYYDCDDTEQVTLELVRYHSVKVIDNSRSQMIEVGHLKIGDCVIFSEYEDGSPIPTPQYLEVVFIDTTGTDPSKVTVQFAPLGGRFDEET